MGIKLKITEEDYEKNSKGSNRDYCGSRTRGWRILWV